MDKVPTMTTWTTRRPKWQQFPAAAPTPRILHLPRKPRRKPQQKAANVTKIGTLQRERRGKLESLFDQEREFARGGGLMQIVMVSGEVEKRERVEKRESMEEEKWRFQAEMLRAECNLLRMEKEIAVKKMERRRVQMERTLRSAVRTLISGRKRICEGSNPSMVLEEEIQQLAQKLEKLQRRPRFKCLEVKKCSNFDKQGSHLQRRLDKFGGDLDELCKKEIRELAEASFSIKATCISQDQENFGVNGSSNMEILRRKMEELSTGTLLERMEDEYGLMLSTGNNSAASSACTSKRIDLSDVSKTSSRQLHKGTKPREDRACSGCCKAIVKRVIEQVRAEAEQWSQMQEMLGQVRDEIQELQASRDFWEDRALDYDYQIRCLQSDVQEWRQKALSSEAKENNLQVKVSTLHTELERLRKEKVTESAKTRDSTPSRDSRESPNEMEKQVLVCRLKENCHTIIDGCKRKEAFCNIKRRPHACSSGHNAPKRSPFRDIGNSSPLVRQNSRAVFPL